MNAYKPIADYHKSMADRLAAANKFVREVGFKTEVVCDTMRNEAMTRFNAHPERICIVQDGLLVHVGGKGPLVYYDIEGVIDWLDAAFGLEKGWTPLAASAPGTSTPADGATPQKEEAAEEAEEEAEEECQA